MQGRSVDAQQMFTAATLMCFVWLAALTMPVRQAQFAEFAGYTAPLTRELSVALLPTLHRRAGAEQRTAGWAKTRAPRACACSADSNARAVPTRLFTILGEYLPSQGARRTGSRGCQPRGQTPATSRISSTSPPLTKLRDRETSIGFRWRWPERLAAACSALLRLPPQTPDANRFRFASAPRRQKPDARSETRGSA